jgi:hypothetical protein
VKKVSRICPPDSAGQLNAPSGNLVRPLTTGAILATVAGSVTVKARSRRSARVSGLRPKTGVTVSTLAAGGTPFGHRTGRQPDNLGIHPDRGLAPGSGGLAPGSGGQHHQLALGQHARHG